MGTKKENYTASLDSSAARPTIPSYPIGSAVTMPYPTLSQDDLEKLKFPFSKDRLGVKVQSFSKDRTRAMLVLYLQHTDVQDRLDEVDTAWAIEVAHEERLGDTVYVRARLTLKGVSRENVGEGGDPKAAYSDALKRCAMLFGVGRYLYDSPTVWTEFDESRDKYREWNPDDFDRALARSGKKPAQTPSVGGASANAASGSVSASASKAIPQAGAPKIKIAANESKTESNNETKPEPKSGNESKATSGKRPGLTTPASGATTESGPITRKSGARPREELNRILMNLYRPYLSQFPDTQFGPTLNSRYGVSETRLMSVDQLEDLVTFLEEKLRSVA